MFQNKLKLCDFRNKFPNLSLFYYKFSPFQIDENSIKDKKWKKDFLLEFPKIDSSNYNDKLKKRLKILRSYAHIIIPMQTQSRFLCGIGYDSTLEWGFSFDWTISIPYLPGSSFKGALLNYLEFASGSPVTSWKDNVINAEKKKMDPIAGNDWNYENVKSIFGEQKKNEDSAVGNVIFLNVYPDPDKFDGEIFNVDVITPHYSSYYGLKGKVAPSDTENPVPLHFLTVKKGVTFLFMVKFRNNVTLDYKNRIEYLIKESGENYGFGAKTSTGYGIMKNVE